MLTGLLLRKLKKKKTLIWFIAVFIILLIEGSFLLF